MKNSFLILHKSIISISYLYLDIINNAYRFAYIKKDQLTYRSTFLHTSNSIIILISLTLFKTFWYFNIIMLLFLIQWNKYTQKEEEEKNTKVKIYFIKVSSMNKLCSPFFLAFSSSISHSENKSERVWYMICPTTLSLSLLLKYMRHHPKYLSWDKE